MIATEEQFVTEEKREDFVRNGFFCLDRIAGPDDIVLIRGELKRLLSQGAGRAEGALTDLVAADGEPSLSPQIMNPSNYSAALRKTQHRANAFKIARAILGPSAKLAFEQMIYKPPGKGAPTPWHQDDAFTSDSDAEVAQISIWMPLQDVTPESGCMRYIAGSHLGPLYEHRSPNNDGRVNALECDLPEGAPNPTYVPLYAGGAVVHHSRTMHSAGPNISANERMAYILAFDGPPRRREGPMVFSWHLTKKTERNERYRQWLWSGGIFIQAWRKIRDGRFNDPRRFGYKAGRWLRRLFRTN